MKTVINDGYISLDDDGKEAGRIEFSTNEKRMNIEHTEVSDAYGGQGLGKKLVAAAVAHAREKNLEVQASCSYAAATIAKDPELQR